MTFMNPVRFLGLACAGVLLSSCQLPEEGEVTIREAEAAAPGHSLAVTGAPLRSGDLNSIAHLLAGMENGHSALDGIRNSSSWTYHQQKMGAMWRHYEATRGEKVRTWANQEIPDLQRYRTAFYPFSGPDFLYLPELFPSADTYILCGLEPADSLPDLRTLTPGEIASGLNGLRSALGTIVDAGYFVTKDMKNDLQATRFRGTLPLLLATLARSGARVDSVTFVQLDASGTPIATNVPGDGFFIRYRAAKGGSKRLFYFKQDLSNGGTKLGGPFLTFVAKQGTPPAMVKSASYLMHQESFSNIRNYLTSSTPGIVQDPSGVPYRNLVNAGLSVDLYGNYQGTLGIFSQQQPDLMAAYSNGQHKVKAVNFGFGYLFNRATTCIMVARRR